ncbi:hypothetical protein B0H99_104202 [Planomicrobium soli]|uniref:Uncharacterized protein n=1 Tax=Planomicrobium soli TaxID=1176648 RepID=A0A2P8H3F8_9BACL|nr:hypothetical protein B0H99_104202 [Planomicrobium soli]
MGMSILVNLLFFNFLIIQTFVMQTQNTPSRFYLGNFNYFFSKFIFTLLILVFSLLKLTVIKRKKKHRKLILF